MDTLKLLSHSLRGAIVAPPGKLLFVADYASIEARVLFFCAREEKGMQMFREGADLYCDLASTIFGRPIIPNPANQPWERKPGKEGILGLGYQMGAPKFVERCALVGVHMPVANKCDRCGVLENAHRRENHPFECEKPAEVTGVQVVDGYRTKYKDTVVKLWYDQETAAGEATYDKEGTEYECYPCTWVKEGRFLYCRLPSGRRLAYPDPAIKTVTTSWGARKNALTFMGVNPKTRKGWHRQPTYGGMLVENIVQAISRDIMAEAMKRCEESRIYSPILTVHDEIICEAHKAHGDVKEFEHLIAVCPEWAKGAPIAAEAWAGPRYRK